MNSHQKTKKEFTYPKTIVYNHLILALQEYTNNDLNNKQCYKNNYNSNNYKNKFDFSN